MVLVRQRNFRLENHGGEGRTRAERRSEWSHRGSPSISECSVRRCNIQRKRRWFPGKLCLRPLLSWCWVRSCGSLVVVTSTLLRPRSRRPGWTCVCGNPRQSCAGSGRQKPSRANSKMNTAAACDALETIETVVRF